MTFDLGPRSKVKSAFLWICHVFRQQTCHILEIRTSITIISSKQISKQISKQTNKQTNKQTCKQTNLCKNDHQRTDKVQHLLMDIKGREKIES